MATLTSNLYLLLKTDALQKPSGAAFFILFMLVSIFFILSRFIETDDKAMQFRVKHTLNMSYMALVAIVLNYVHNTLAGLIFSFLLVVSTGITLMLLILNYRNNDHYSKYKFFKLINQGVLAGSFLTIFIIFNFVKQ